MGTVVTGWIWDDTGSLHWGEFPAEFAGAERFSGLLHRTEVLLGFWKMHQE
jgi:hypothetical protein